MDDANLALRLYHWSTGIPHDFSLLLMQDIHKSSIFAGVNHTHEIKGSAFFDPNSVSIGIGAEFRSMPHVQGICRSKPQRWWHSRLRTQCRYHIPLPHALHTSTHFRTYFLVEKSKTQNRA